VRFIKLSLKLGAMITTVELKALEKKAQDNGITLLELMENAGLGAFKVLNDKYDLDRKHVIIFAGGGNNAGDGFVLARYLHESGIQTVVLFCGMEEKLSDEAKVNFDRLQDIIPIVTIDNPEEFSLFNFQKSAQFILVDALLGTGMSGPLREPVRTAIEIFNKTKSDKISIDVPSGINPDTGVESDVSCMSDLIITFHDIKVGLEKFKDITQIVDIGLLEKKEDSISKSDDVVISKV
jgi:ADP-dependent NAD(P)H-hydrate dehydratase / NAD(P)H-hydrate epimerase